MGQHKEGIKTAIRDEFLGRFKNMKARAGDLLPGTWLYDDFMANLSAKEQLTLEEIINEMIKDGLIAYVGGTKPTYALTQKVVDILC